MYRIIHSHRRLLAMLLSLSLLFSALPVVSHAAKAEEKADITDKFTDPVFRETVYSHIRKQAGEPIYDTDVAQVKELYVSEYSSDLQVKVRSLTGLEYFTGLEVLDLYYCRSISALDVRPLKHLKELSCHGCRLKALDLRGLNELEAVYCGENELTELLVASPALIGLQCSNNLLTELDLSGCPNLDFLSCGDNYLESLDLSGCPKLRSLGCAHNYMKDSAAVVGFDAPADSEAFSFSPQYDERIVPRLGYDTRACICADYARSCTDVALTPEEVFIETYYGCYDGLHIVNLWLHLPKLDVEQFIRVGGYGFRFPDYFSRRFLAYRDGTFYTLPEAYASGLLSREGLRELFYHYYEGYSIPFTDVTADKWYYDSVKSAWVCQLFDGVGRDRFAPEGAMTRAMLVTVLWRMNGEPYVEGPSPFIDVPDVPNGTWYTGAVIWAAKNKIVEGVGEGRFAPDSPVTREQFVTILHRLSGKPEPAAAVDESKFGDYDKVSGWAQDAMRWAVSTGIVTGSKQADGALLLNPGAHATRAQAAALLMRCIDQLPDLYPVTEEEVPEEELP